MTTGHASVVTPERYKKGISYQECTIKSDDAAFFKKAKAAGATHMLALGEDWCPDVYRGLPVFQRLSEASGIELKVFPRDANLDIMQEFLNQGQFQSIPTIVFYNDKTQYLMHWIERPKFANDDRTRIRNEVTKELVGKAEKDVNDEVRKRTLERYNLWQQESVKEVRTQLAEKLKIK